MLASNCPSGTEEAGVASVCSGCESRGQCAALRGMVTAIADDEQLRVRLGAIRRVLLVLSGKGGVGKSTVAAAIARRLAADGERVALLDVDVCGPSAPRLMNVRGQVVTQAPHGWLPATEPEHGVRVMSLGLLLGVADEEAAVIWRGPRKTQLIRRLLRETYWGKLDYLIVDTPPGTSDEHMSVLETFAAAAEAAALAAHRLRALLITTPQAVARQTVAREVTFCESLRVRVLGVLENMAGFVCPCCEEVTHVFPAHPSFYSSVVYDGSGAAEATDEQQAVQRCLPLLGRVPLDARIGAASDQGRCGECAHPKSASTIAMNDATRNIVEYWSSSE